MPNTGSGLGEQMVAAGKSLPVLIPTSDASAGLASPGSLRRLLIGIALLSASLMMLLMSLNSTAIPMEAVKWGGIILAVYIFGLFALILAFRGPSFGLGSWRLGPWMMIWAAVMFGIASSINMANYQFGPAPQLIISNVLSAFWLVAVGMTAWLAAYLIGPGRLIGKAVARWTGALQKRYTEDIRGSAPWLLYAIGSAARIILILSTARIGYVGSAASTTTTASWYDHGLISLAFCAPVGVATAVLSALRRSGGGRWASVAVLISAEAAFALISGDKTPFAVLILAVVIPYTAVRGGLPWKLLALAAIVFFAVVTPFNHSYRQTARTGTATISAQQAVNAAPGLLGGTLSGGSGLTTQFLTSVNDVLSRSQYIVVVAIIMQETPGEIPYIPKSQMFTGIVSGMIPRLIWPGKPIDGGGAELQNAYFDGSAKRTAIAFTIIGSLYVYGGWGPLVLGMLLVGFLFRIIDDIIDVRRNPHTVFISLFFFQPLVTIEASWVSTVLFVVLFIPIWVLTVALAFQPRRRALA